MISCMGYSSMAALQMLYRHRVRVPEGISVVGYDDMQAFAYCSPPLTTVRQPTEEIGRSAVRLLTELNDGATVTDAILPVELVCRESTGPVRH